MEIKTLINSRELFLLCALRKGGVYAKNMEKYEWTFRHFSYFQSELRKFHERTKSDNLKKEDYETSVSTLKIKARNQYPSIVKMRLFTHHDTDFGLVLNEHEEDMTWYGPQFENEEWVYKGEFILQEPLTEKEEFILKHYC